MTFSFYAVTRIKSNYTNYELGIDGIVCSFRATSILNLIKKLEVYYVNYPEVILLSKKVSAIEYFQPKIDNNEVTIVNICNVTYKSMEEFIANIIPDLHKMHPELLI